MDRPIWGFERGANGDLHNRGKERAYECYILWGMWRSMEPERMKHILNRMLKAQYNVVQVNKIREALDSIK